MARPIHFTCPSLLAALLAGLLAACQAETMIEIPPAPIASRTVRQADAALARKVERTLGIDHGSLPYGVEVTAHDGRVVLWGTVASHAERSRFETVAAGTVGVQLVINLLRVDPGA